MGKGLRLTERWMQRLLWIVALLFAGFLIGLAAPLVADLASLAPVPPAETYVDQARLAAVKARSESAEAALGAAREAREQAAQKHVAAQADTRSARETFDNWIATRHATVRPEQDAELIARTRELDRLAEAERRALAAVETQQQAELDARQALAHANEAYRALLAPAEEAAFKAERAAELRVFGYRLALTLPLLAAAAWLFRRKRNATYWPFAWGFIFFALFVFFFELVPYLPSYGGYVRNGIGILLTVLGGRYAIRWLNAWLARQKAIEALPEQQRRSGMRYDLVLGRIAKGLCPSCERPTDYKDPTLAHCPHCGFQLFDRCPACAVRKNALLRFCYSCGTPANTSLAD